ncbi:MAG: aldehyde dehydrogenase [Gammaproteobacteria bacterium]
MADPIRIENYIGGSLRAPASRDYLDDYEPATGRVYAKTPESDEADLTDAVAAAETAFAEWRATSTDARAGLLLDLAARIDAQAEAFAQAESIDTGKPIRLARDIDIPRASANLRFYAAAATQFASESHAMEGAINYTLRQPHGVVACISPWNLPLYLLTWKIAPALAAGNCVIAKPSEVTPMTAYLFAQLCIEAGVPPGVLNILHGTGSGIGHALVTHPAIRAISFTGGTVTGRRIAKEAAPLFKKLSLELGGKNPTIVFGDCDWDRMLATTLRSAFSNQGQICLCGSRIFVEQSVYERFCEDFVKLARALRVGDPLDASTEQGAIVSRPHMDKVLGCIALARDEGCNVLCGGAQLVLEGPRCAEGWFISPTVIEGLPSDCRTNQEEIFGPVVTLIPFTDEEEVLEQANAIPYGLAASLWSSDVKRCHRMAAALEAGIIWINTWMLRDLRTPMGGMKASGVGREGGMEAMRFFTEAKNVCVNYV